MKTSYLKVFLIVLSFLTINLSPVHGLDYFPLLFLFVPIFWGFSLKLLVYYLFFSVVILFFLLSEHNINSVIQVLVFLYLLIFLSSMFNDFRSVRRAAVILLWLHFIFFVLWIFYPNISNELIGSRGHGRNSFFYKEPSYAAISIFSIAITYLLALRFEHVKNIDFFSIFMLFLVVIFLLSTLSLTGFLFAFIFLLYLFLYLKFEQKAFVILGLVFILSFAIFDPLTRLDFIFNNIDGFMGLLKVANNVEPSGAWRINLNIISFYVSHDSPLGLGRFYVNKNEIYLPSDFYFIIKNELFDVFYVIKGQALFSSFVIALGIFGFVFVAFIYITCTCGYLSLLKNRIINFYDFCLINFFILYSIFYQSSLTSAPILLIMSIGLLYASKRKHYYSNF